MQNGAKNEAGTQNGAKSKAGRRNSAKDEAGTQNGAKAGEIKHRQSHADARRKSKRSKGEANGVCVRTNTI